MIIKDVSIGDVIELLEALDLYDINNGTYVNIEVGTKCVIIDMSVMNLDIFKIVTEHGVTSYLHRHQAFVRL